MTLYTVYKTTNSINGKYYFGVHKTKNPYDVYLGSGTYIRRAVTKYGEQNFHKEVLFIYLDHESAFGKEDELIQCYRGRDPLCMNLRKGGSGGFDYINRHNIHSTSEGRIKLKNMLLLDPDLFKRAAAKRRPEWRKAISDGLKLRANNNWTGRKHLQRSHHKMSEAAKQQDRTGSRNSQFGTCWITNGVVEQKIKIDSLPNFPDWKRGRLKK